MASANRQGDDQGYFQISVRGTEGGNLPLEEVTKFLYEFNLLYEMSRLVVDPRYEAYKITQATSSRVVNRLWANDKLYLEKLSVNSPLDLNLILNATEVALTAIGVVLTAIGLRQNRSSHRDNEVSFDRHEPGIQEPDNRAIVFADAGIQLRLPPPDGDFREKLQIRKATKHYDREEKRLQENPVSVDEVSIAYTRETQRRGH
jgi:hypothetical protein